VGGIGSGEGGGAEVGDGVGEGKGVAEGGLVGAGVAVGSGTLATRVQANIPRERTMIRRSVLTG
jgi:hypothetical protein